MKNIIQKAIMDQVYKLYHLKPKIEISIPAQSSRGDYTTNIAFQIAPKIGAQASDVAKTISQDLKIKEVNQIEVQGSGFINFWIDNNYFYNNLLTVGFEGSNYGRCQIGKGCKYNIEFVSANPTGELHLGNARGAAYGDNLARILTFCGYEVTKEYYINDAGNQIDQLGLSLQSRYLSLCGQNQAMPEEGYFGAEIQAIASQIYRNHQTTYMKKPLEYFKNKASSELLAKIIKILKTYGVVFDCFTSEKEIYRRYSLPTIINDLKKQGYIYEKDQAIWFKSSSLLDDKDHVLVKKDGNYTYLLPDIAYHIDKYQRGYHKIIDVLGTDHHGYVARLKSGLKACGYDETKLEVKLLQLVRLIQGKTIVKMSKRAGTTITLEQLIAEVGVGAARYFFAMRSLDTQMDFDLQLAQQRTTENPFYYVSYAYARINTILKEHDISDTLTEFKYLPQKKARQLVNFIYQFPEVVQTAALKELPHLITNYVFELASLFHQYYAHNRIVVTNRSELSENLCLIKAIKITIKNALELIGVEPLEKM